MILIYILIAALVGIMALLIRQREDASYLDVFFVSVLWLPLLVILIIKSLVKR